MFFLYCDVETNAVYKCSAPFTGIYFSFLFLQRVQLFNKFATWAMCMAGIPVLDMYPLTATWPHGTQDHIHYSDDVIEPAVLALERFLSKRFQQL